MTAPAEEVVEQDADCDDQLGHWMCRPCHGVPIMGVVYRTLCGIRKQYQGGRRDLPWCAVCDFLRKRPCERCGA